METLNFQEKENHVPRVLRSKIMNNFVHGKKFEDKNNILKNKSNGVKPDAKRIKLTVRSESLKTTKKEEIVKQLAEKTQETNKPVVQKKVADNVKQSLEDLVFQIGKENLISKKEKETIKDGLSLGLLYADEYRQDIWKYISRLETEGPRPKPNYMLKQHDINWNNRTVLVDWLATVSEEFHFYDQTFHLGIAYIDSFLSFISVVRNKFQLVGAAAMMLATKMEEYYPIDSKEWSYLTGDTFTPSQVLRMEKMILKVLKFDMQSPTIYTFIQHLSTEEEMDDKTIHLAMYIAELVLLEGQEYMNHVPSKLAAASLALARHTLSKGNPWPEKLKAVSGYTLKELSPVVKRQHQTFVESPLKAQQAIQSKYKSDKYNRVALLKPRSLWLDGLEEDSE